MESSFSRVFGDTPKNRMWEFLIDSRGLFDFSMTDITEAANISWNTMKELFPSFVKDGVVEKTRNVGRATMYKLNENNPKSVFMIGVYNAINMAFIRGGHLKVEVNIIRSGKMTPIDLDMNESSLKTSEPIAN